MAGGWFLAVNVLFPIPFLLLLLLSVPLPARIRARTRDMILRIVDVVLFFKIGGVSIYAVLTSVSIFLFGLTAWETGNYTAKLKLSLGTNDERGNRALKWRSERNFWISLFSLTLWLLLYRIRALMIEINGIKKRG
jgi:hypothetical protein